MHENRGMWLLLALLVALVVIGPLLVGGMMGPGVMMGPGMMWGYGGQGVPTTSGWGWGIGMVFGWLAMLAFWGLLVIGVVMLVRWIAGVASHPEPPAAESPLDILKRRLAAGEIKQSEFDEIRKVLESH